MTDEVEPGDLLCISTSVVDLVVLALEAETYPILGLFVDPETGVARVHHVYYAMAEVERFPLPQRREP